MNILSLVENTTKCELKVKHALSLYIETAKHKLLFDVGQDSTLFQNAKTRNIDLTKVDTVIISHGHKDHGGALKDFLAINHTAKVYIQRKAFGVHSTKVMGFKVPIGLDESLKNHPQVVLLDGNYKIDEELSLFIVKDNSRCHSTANDILFSGKVVDDFVHEQNLIINENSTVLIMGCGHTGIVNIMEEAKSYHPTLCIGGYHLMNPVNKKCVPDELLDQIAAYMNQYPDTKFYTCHCTGEKAYNYLASKVPNLSYFACGDQLKA